MAASAERTGMDCIVTRNIRDYAGLSLPVYTPSAFLEALASNEEL